MNFLENMCLIFYEPLQKTQENDENDLGKAWVNG